MGKKKDKKSKKRFWCGFNFGHLHSQKFAALIFCVIAICAVAFFLEAAAFGNVCLAVTGLYTAFVGGRAWSDSAAMKFRGRRPNTVDDDSVNVNIIKRDDDDEDDDHDDARRRKDRDDEID